MIKTKNFNPKYDKKLLCTCNHPKCDKRSVNQETLNKAQLVRNDANRPLIVRSGGRCQYHPDELNRIHPADHQKRNGIDIAVSGAEERAEIVKLGFGAGFNAIGVAKTFVHLGHRQELINPYLWVY